MNQGKFESHLFNIDQTLHWANPGAGISGRDKRGTDPSPWTGPVPVVVHLHGGFTEQWADGYPEAWYLPDASDIDPNFAKVGSLYAEYENEATCPWAAGPPYLITKIIKTLRPYGIMTMLWVLQGSMCTPAWQGSIF